MRQIPLLLLFSTLLSSASSSSSLRGFTSLPDPNTPYNLLNPACETTEQPPPTPKPWSIFASENNLSDTNEEHVIIPCNEVIRIDAGMHLIFHRGLTIEGTLQFEDDVNRPIHLESAFVLVLGYMEIGSSEDEPHRSKLNIELMESSSEDDYFDIVVEKEELLGKYSPINFGQKAFIVLGGQVSIFGDYPERYYTHLDRDVGQGSREVFVRGYVDWIPGDVIGIASSIVRGQFSSYGQIQEVVPQQGDDDDVTMLILEEGVENTHLVRSLETTSHREYLQDDDETKTPGDAVWLRPEVAKLNRNIVISGSESHSAFGGHFTISHTRARQIISGVEFFNMGQAGLEHRYPLLMSFGGYVPPNTKIANNAFHHCHQRCVVLQATHDVVVEHNVAYRTHGHCFATVDGIETGNVFFGNLAINVLPVLKTMDYLTAAEHQTDDYSSGFYMASPTNDLVGNVVAGAHHTGFFYESFDRIRGDSLRYELPGWDDDTLNPKRQPFGAFRNNLAHSVPIGLNPGYGRSPPTPMIFEGFTAWSVFMGFHSRSGRDLILANVTVIDFYSAGVSALDANGFRLEEALLAGELEFPKVCHARPVSGVRLSSSRESGVRLQNIHFQRLSSQTNCQDHNVAVEILPSEEGRSTPVVHSSVNNLSFDLYDVDTHWKALIPTTPLVLQVGEAGAGKLPPNGSLVTIGWDNFDPIMEGICIVMEPMAEGLGLAYCPNICWNTLVLEFDGGVGDRLEITSHQNGRTWMQLSKPVVDGPVERRSIQLTLPVGEYDMKLLNGNGLVVENLPDMEMYNLSGDLCEGNIESYLLTGVVLSNNKSL